MFTSVKRTELFPLPDMTVERTFAASLAASIKLARLQMPPPTPSPQPDNSTTQPTENGHVVDGTDHSPSSSSPTAANRTNGSAACADDLALLAVPTSPPPSSSGSDSFRCIDDTNVPTSTQSPPASLKSSKSASSLAPVAVSPSQTQASHSTESPTSPTTTAIAAQEDVEPDAACIIQLWSLTDWLLVGESPIFVGVASRHSRLVLTNYRLFHGNGSPLYVVGQRSQQKMGAGLHHHHHHRSGLSAGPTTEVYFNVAIAAVDRVRANYPPTLQVEVKDGRIYRVAFDSADALEEWRKRVDAAIQPPAKIDGAFAFTHHAWATDAREADDDVNNDITASSSSSDDEDVVSNRISRAPCRSLTPPASSRWFDAELDRLGFDLSIWRVSHVNANFKMCATYPERLITPRCISDTELERVATFRSAKRIPSVVYRYAATGAVLARSSQPEVGLLGWRSTEDEQLIQAIYDACTADAIAAGRHSRHASLDSRTPIASRLSDGDRRAINGSGSGSRPDSPLARTRWQSDSPYSTRAACDAGPASLLSSTSVGSSSDQNSDSVEALVALPPVDKASELTTPPPPTSTNASTHRRSRMLIVDARSYAAAVTNRARGGGVECEEYYPNAEIVFMYLANIHAIRKSFNSLRDLLNGSVGAASSTESDANGHAARGDPLAAHEASADGSVDESTKTPSATPATAPAATPNPAEAAYLQSLDGTRWLSSTSALLSTAERVVRALCLERRPVLVHCSDGWDRTPQVVGLAQLLIDPYYRTMAGFQVLVEREWLDHGHKMDDRCGMAGDDNERSPIFLQWLDCCFQLINQFPTAFEFNDTYLALLARHVYSNLFGDFLCNSLRERIASHVSQRTRSVFTYLGHASQRPYVINYLYDAPSATLSAPSPTPIHHLAGFVDANILWPRTEVRELVVWKDVYVATPVESRRVTRPLLPVAVHQHQLPPSSSMASSTASIATVRENVRRSTSRQQNHKQAGTSDKTVVAAVNRNNGDGGGDNVSAIACELLDKARAMSRMHKRLGPSVVVVDPTTIIDSGPRATGSLFDMDGLLHVDNATQSRINALLYTSASEVEALRTQLAAANRVAEEARFEADRLRSELAAAPGGHANGTAAKIDVAGKNSGGALTAKSPVAAAALATSATAVVTATSLPASACGGGGGDADDAPTSTPSAAQISMAELADALTDFRAGSDATLTSRSSSASSYTISSIGSASTPTVVAAASAAAAASCTTTNVSSGSGGGGSNSSSGGSGHSSMRRLAAAAEKVATLFDSMTGGASGSGRKRRTSATATASTTAAAATATPVTPLAMPLRRGPSTSSWDSVGDAKEAETASTSTSADDEAAAAAAAAAAGQMTRWLVENAVTSCANCGRQFWFGRHRHHCRRCGCRICSACSAPRGAAAAAVSGSGSRHRVRRQTTHCGGDDARAVAITSPPAIRLCSVCAVTADHSVLMAPLTTPLSTSSTTDRATQTDAADGDTSLDSEIEVVVEAVEEQDDAGDANTAASPTAHLHDQSSLTPVRVQGS